MLAGALAKHAGVIAVGRPQADLADPETLEAMLRIHDASIVVCAGAFTQVDRAESAPEEAMRINAAGPGALARLCAARGVPLIHISTDYVFDGEKPAPYVETDAPAPLNAYGRSKLAGEQSVAAAGGRFAILRTSWTYAASGANFVRTMLRLAQTQDRIRVVDDQRGAPTWAPHLADAVLAVARRLVAERDTAICGVFHATADGDCTWRGFAEAIFDGARRRGGPSAAVEPIAGAQFPTAAARPRNSLLDSSKLRETYGVALPDWRAGLEACLDEIASGGWRVD
ncbi:MAG: dTDP-4-dehydrorhamnose reductase [Hyphomonadaceae bacterium]|nr:dTDP-4-dehydrorhamnose reductase [Hyphomonadaceae bacterium]